MCNLELIEINISSSFVYRARCAKCSTQPIYYYVSRNPVLWYDPNKNKNIFEFIKKYYKRLSTETDNLSFRYSSKIGYYNHLVNYKGYRPKLHRTRGVNPVFDLVESLTCKCGHTIWFFAEKSIINRPEIFNRKSKNKYTYK